MPFCKCTLGNVRIFKSGLITVLLFLALSLSFSEPAFSQQAVTGSKVLVLFDTNTFSPWDRAFSEGFQDHINNVQSNFSNLRIAFQFLGLNDYPAGIRPDEVIDSLEYKQQVDPAAVIISALSTTASFLRTYGDELFPGVPIVYVSPGRELGESIRSQNLPNILVSPSGTEVAFEKTLTVISQILPDTEQIFVVSGISELDVGYVKRVESIFDNLAIGMTPTYLTGLPVEELRSTLSSLPENSAVLILSYQRDRNHTALRAIDVLSLILDSVNAPLFTPIDSTFVDGVVGGNIINTFLAGRQAAEMALALLSDRQSSAIGSVAATTYRFDQRQLRRWAIDERLLPPDSIIENRQLNVIELYGQQLLILLTVFGIMLFFVIFLKRQASDLRRQKTLFESVIGSIPDAILLTDADANIFAANAGASATFDFSHDELLGMNTKELIATGLDSGSSGEIVASIENSNQLRVVTYKKKTGESFSGETIATQITSAAGETLGHFALVRDISKRLSVEEEQRQGQKMEALGNLVGGISHDFNNVLGVISGYAELTLACEDSQPPDKNLKKILQATERAKLLVGQIMNFSRDTSSEQKPTELKLLLAETMKLIQVSIPKHTEIRLNIDEAVRPIMGAEVQLQQIVVNLATNAYQAMEPAGGTLTIALERQVVGTEVNLSHGVLVPGGYSVLKVSDNGPGMSSEVASRVFEPFFTTKARGEGSGMGMAIVYKLLKAHGAIVDLQTAPGAGTRIKLYFKELTNVAIEPDKEKESAVVKGNGERILLVDDEEDMLDSALQLLAGIGYSVEAFSDPNKALEVFRRTPDKFDLLISDENMPKLTGTQLVKAVRKIKPHFPAIICTGYSEVLSHEEVQQMALDGVVRKPFTLEEIAKTISNALSK